MNKYKTIEDIIIFGSVVKGSSSPNDLDIALILKNESELANIKGDIRSIARNVDIEIIDSIYTCFIFSIPVCLSIL